MKGPRDGITSLYRMYAADGELLYVGITNSLPNRVVQHGKSKAWFHLVSDIKVEHHPDRLAAELAETVAIRDESPAFNIDGRVDPPRDLAGYPDPTVVRPDKRMKRVGTRRSVHPSALIGALRPDPGATFDKSAWEAQLFDVLEEHGHVKRVSS